MGRAGEGKCRIWARQEIAIARAGEGQGRRQKMAGAGYEQGRRGQGRKCPGQEMAKA